MSNRLTDNDSPGNFGWLFGALMAFVAICVVIGVLTNQKNTMEEHDWRPVHASVNVSSR